MSSAAAAAAAATFRVFKLAPLHEIVDHHFDRNEDAVPSILSVQLLETFRSHSALREMLPLGRKGGKEEGNKVESDWQDLICVGAEWSWRRSRE